jgi:hypothetical protein
MADNTGNEAKKNLKEINEIVSAIDSGFRSISSRLEDVADIISNTNNDARVFKNIINDVGRSINRLSKQNESLIDNQIKLNQGLLTSKKVREQINNLEATRNVLESRLKTLRDQQLDGLILNKEQLNEIKNLETELAQQSQDVTLRYEDQLKKLEKIETKLGIFGRLTKGLSKIPLVGDLLDAEGALQAMNKSALKSESLFKNLGAGISAAFKGIERASVILTLFSVVKEIIDFIKDAMFAMDERTTNIAKNLSISKDSAAGLYSSLTKLKGTLETELGTTKNIVEAFNDLAGITEFTTIATDKQIDAQIILTKELGLSKEAALGFQESLAVSNTEATKGVDIVYDQIAAFANQNKIVADGRKIFDQINKTSKLIQLNFKGNIPLLTKTILEANKLGLSLDQVDKIAGSLLDFESSISAELEAELLTGRNINLERARLFALNNDIAGLTKEIANQGINAANFASMNRIQQEAIAKALGMSASELGDSLYKQELINKVAGNYTNRLKEEARLLKASNNDRDIAKGLALEQQAIDIENGIFQGKTLEQAQRSLTAQEKFNNALERVKEIFSDIVTNGLLDRLVKLVENLVDSLEGAGGRENRAQKTFSNIKTSENYKNYTDVQKEAINELNKQAEDQVGFIESMFLNMLPGGSMISKIKDIRAKSALKALSAIEKGEIKPNNEQPADDFISRPGQPIQKFRKDDIIIGGTSLGGGSDEEIKTLLKELVNAVKAGGNVYLDSNKVGTAMAMGTYKTQ